MPSKKLYFALTLAVASLGIAVASHPAARAASASVAQPAQSVAGMCYHVDFSDYVCPDSSTSLRYPLPATALEVQSVSVKVTYKDGRTITSQLPTTTDAVFLSKKSLHTFLLLHYLATDDKKFNELLAYINKSTPAKAPPKTPARKP